uniref:penicillin-insensitive murein endopeptidase n=1 Tax=Thaumasiovibrio occultus TaxID=1891184 RepID=UPI000B353083|nr:penicillin-insensitive murein endopeptidase [Thaumasiovibrio occultus]
MGKCWRWGAWALVSSVVVSSVAMATPWHQFDSPTRGHSNSIGSYANGCLAGGKALPLEGEGYQVIRSSRNRYYGHEKLVNFIEDLGQKTSEAGINDLLIGDMSMPRGGRFTSGHASHQTGLDVDIWMRQAEDLLTRSERESIHSTNMVNLEEYRIQFRSWTDDHANMVRFAAQDERVARIFVHPVIKETLCRETWEDRSWLRKVRPWYGHTSHMHVRLTCPDNDQYCQNQALPPPGDGCGEELYSWRPEAQETSTTVTQLRGGSGNSSTSTTTTTSRPNRQTKVQPQQCDTVIVDAG